METVNSSEEGLDKATFQCDDMFGHLKFIDGHASKNVFKRCQNMITIRIPGFSNTPN
jgi:hypothetical protein